MSTELTRYSHRFLRGYIPDPAGRFVTFDDYLLIQEERDSAAQRVDELAEILSGKTTLESLQISKGGFSAVLGTEMASFMASCFIGLLDERRAENYIEVNLRTRDGKELSCTIRRENGKTVGQVNSELKLENARLRKELETLKGA